MKKRWELALKYSFFNNYTDKVTEETKKKKRDASYRSKAKETLEKEAKDTTERIFDEWFSSLKQMPRSDWFSIFLNSYAEALDPHSKYFAPDLKEEFENHSAGKFEGIGAGLKKNTRWRRNYRHYTRWPSLENGFFTSGRPHYCRWRSKSKAFQYRRIVNTRGYTPYQRSQRYRSSLNYQEKRRFGGGCPCYS